VKKQARELNTENAENTEGTEQRKIGGVARVVTDDGGREWH
jgi:hypothetical protein